MKEITEEEYMQVMESKGKILGFGIKDGVSFMYDPKLSGDYDFEKAVAKATPKNDGSGEFYFYSSLSM